MQESKYMELKRTYIPFTEWTEQSKQTQYTEPTPLLAENGTKLEIKDLFAFCEYVENRW